MKAAIAASIVRRDEDSRTADRDMTGEHPMRRTQAMVEYS
jgi:hypothetical protein